MKTTIVKGCLYCGLRLPEQADFCPECGRPLEDAVNRADNEKMRRTTHGKECLYCGLRFPDSADLCSECDRQLQEAA
jgi:predicted amidophosphoribosyltransferase